MAPWPAAITGSVVLDARSSQLPNVSRKLPSPDGKHFGKEAIPQEMAHSL